MDDARINEAVTYVREAAAQVDRLASEVLGAFREGRFYPSPVGSAAYVRGLRDQAAVSFYAGYLASPSVGKYTHDEARADANALIKALGYEPPEESGQLLDDPLKTYIVRLLGYDEGAKIQTIRAVRYAAPEHLGGLKVAKSFVEMATSYAPGTVRRNLPHDRAQRLARDLRASGAVVEVIPEEG